MLTSFKAIAEEAKKRGWKKIALAGAVRSLIYGLVGY